MEEEKQQDVNEWVKKLKSEKDEEKKKENLDFLSRLTFN